MLVRDRWRAWKENHPSGARACQSIGEYAVAILFLAGIFAYQAIMTVVLRTLAVLVVLALWAMKHWIVWAVFAGGFGLYVALDYALWWNRRRERRRQRKDSMPQWKGGVSE